VSQWGRLRSRRAEGAEPAQRLRNVNPRPQIADKTKRPRPDYPGRGRLAVGTWAAGVAERPPRGSLGDPGVPTISLAGEKPPRHRYAKRPSFDSRKGPLHPCLVTAVGVTSACAPTLPT
jgi:hypothetical protein